MLGNNEANSRIVIIMVDEAIFDSDAIRVLFELLHNPRVIKSCEVDPNTCMI